MCEGTPPALNQKIPCEETFQVITLLSRRQRQGEGINVFKMAGSLTPHIPGPVTLQSRQSIPDWAPGSLKAEFKGHLVTWSSCSRRTHRAELWYHPSTVLPTEALHPADTAPKGTPGKYGGRYFQLSQRGRCSWHLLGRAQGCCQHPMMHKTAPRQRVSPSQCRLCPDGDDLPWPCRNRGLVTV